MWTPPGARRGAVGPALSCPLCSLQGDRGFDGLAGLPGEKGHRVSVCCLGATGSSRVRALRGSLRVPRGPDPRSQSCRYVSLMGVGPDMDRTSWGRELSPRRAHFSTPLTTKGPLGSVPQGARRREVASAQGPPHCQETQQLPCGGRPELSAPLKGQLRDAGRPRMASPVDGGGVGAAAGLV